MICTETVMITMMMEMDRGDGPVRAREHEMDLGSL